MEILRELIYIVKTNRITKIDLLEENPEQDSKIMELYNRLGKNEFENDDEAAEQLYRSDKSNPAYQKLKTTLKTKLVNHLFFIDTKTGAYTARQSAYYESYKDWAATKILIGKNARTSGISFCHKILKHAKRFEFTDLALDIVKTLRLHYGAREGNLKKFEHYNHLFKSYKEVVDHEDIAEELYTDLVLRYVNSKAAKEEVNQKAQEYFNLLKPSLEKYDTYRLYLCASLIELSIHSSINDYQETIEVCNRYIQFFSAKKYVANVPLQIFYYQLLVCHIQLQQYDQGKLAAEKCLALLEDGSFNWFKYQELYFTLSMHTKNYQQAYFIYSKVIDHKRFSFLPDNVKEIWRIFKTYLHFVIEIGKIKIGKVDREFSKFKLGRFLNDIPIYSKDKRGMNIPILVAQILFRLQQKRYDEAIDRIEAIEKYCARYLTRNDTFRSNCFIKLLLQIPISGFHRAAVDRKAKKYLVKLKSMPLIVANQSHEIEIIPYEELWEMALNTLGKKIIRTKKMRASRKRKLQANK